MSEQIVSVTIPQSWSEITLEKYLKYRKNLDMFKDDEDYNEQTLLIALDILCGVDIKYITQIGLDNLKLIQEDLSSFMGKTDFELQRLITVNGIEYGFEPNLSNIAYGAYLDISKHDTIAIDNNWQKIMAVLYRKVKSKSGKYYDIEPYTGNEDYEWVKNTTMDINYGCLFFFINLSKDLVLSTLKSLKKEEWETHQLLKSIMGKNGEGMLQLLSSQTETSQSSIR
jgi:hypothetical protein